VLDVFKLLSSGWLLLHLLLLSNCNNLVIVLYEALQPRVAGVDDGALFRLKDSVRKLALERALDDNIVESPAFP